MRTHGELIWNDSIQANGSRARELFGVQSLAPQLDLFPHSSQRLSPRDEAVFLLHVAAEVEHALMVQYLYTMFSFGPAATLSPPKSDWVIAIRDIAKQEMGHLITVQNLALALGGSITFEREDYPISSEFYPFPLILERPTRDVFAKYVIAEMPPLHTIANADTRQTVQEAMVRSQSANGGVVVNRVGALYSKIIHVVGHVPEEEFNFETADTYQAAPNEISQTSGPGGHDPVDSIMCWPITSKQTALDALDLVATQGEGPLRAVGTSHFDKFLKIFHDFPETNALFGIVEENPARPVPTNPRFDTDGTFDLEKITEPISVQLAQFGNLRYRLVLDGLSHYLLVNREDRPGCKAYLASFCTFEMLNTVTPIGIGLTSTMRQFPNVFVDGFPAVAGLPFHMPYSLSLSPDESSRWRSHVNILVYSGRIAQELVSNPDCPNGIRSILNSILGNDQDSITAMNAAADDDDVDCE